MLAFELADKYRNPAVILTDGFVGQMMEPLDLEDIEIQAPDKPWAVKGTVSYTHLRMRGRVRGCGSCRGLRL